MLREIVLIVDDDRVILSGLGHALTREGRSVILCMDMEAAKLIVDVLPVTHVVSDIRLSGPFQFEGLGLLQYVGEHSPGTRVILMTGMGGPELQHEAESRGTVAFLEKPFAVETLEKIIAEGCRDIGESNLSLAELIELPGIDEILASNGLTTVFQPIHRLDGVGNPIFAFEALTRLITPSPLSNPSLLFRYAAEKRRLADLEMACLQRAFREAESLPHSALIFANVHPSVFADGRRVVETVRGSSISPSRLVLEITEQAPMRDDDAAWSALTDLRNLGVRFAFDDVGIAYSHFQHMSRVQPAFLKISQHFGTAFEADHVNEMIVRSILQLTSNLSRQMVLEGIESEATMRRAVALGIPLGQGYYFARPAPASSFS